LQTDLTDSVDDVRWKKRRSSGWKYLDLKRKCCGRVFGGLRDGWSLVEVI